MSGEKKAARLREAEAKVARVEAIMRDEGHTTPCGQEHCVYDMIRAALSSGRQWTDDPLERVKALIEREKVEYFKRPVGALLILATDLEAALSSDDNEDAR